MILLVSCKKQFNYYWYLIYFSFHYFYCNCYNYFHFMLYFIIFRKHCFIKNWDYLCIVFLGYWYCLCLYSVYSEYPNLLEVNLYWLVKCFLLHDSGCCYSIYDYLKAGLKLLKICWKNVNCLYLFDVLGVIWNNCTDSKQLIL